MDDEKYLFQEKYRIASNRLHGFDYRSNGSYFVTICTKNKEPWFGEIRNGVLCLSNIGQVAYKCWDEIPNHFKYVSLGEYILSLIHI